MNVHGTGGAGMRDGRRGFLRHAAGTVIAVLGGLYVVLEPRGDADAEPERRPDGRVRVPPGQQVIAQLRPMGGQEGDARPSEWRLDVHGEVDAPYRLTLAELLALPQAESTLDVHCVTRWTVLGARWSGVPVRALAERAKVRASARHVIFEAAHGYTSNVPIDEALAPQNLVAHRLDDHPLARVNGGPVRAVIPDLYFWKSPKWLTGIRFAARDEPGYWETRGYHNHGDPWKEQRYA